ncbi:peptide-methionine (S)-S-oxide reductase MsrA [Helicobacter sp. 13S00477-4]|uniref:peptide-methionine (S)-S-oxide reductase MsrA n=1 Tax=Helicobacter sp. 13S00477-4 TaxID=1905759 RepID=UPI000BA5F6B4|nr:peptide-methionine (S)-S-oxide reductase MsrA [Helicobacter sp. 13S00477-4]PAF50594.1 peptide-methionine (S)-S-oxide reductase [Helicobacter sp. 13S00477-4]
MLKTIYLAGGCFWGLQGYFDLIEGVCKSEVGYAQSNIPNPSYELVCTGMSNAVETVRIVYNDQKLDLEEILQRFFSVIDPTLLNRQGNDIGSQYRTGIYTQNNDTLEKIYRFIQRIQYYYDKPIQTEVKELKNYYPAEPYHQKYLQKNPQGYCHIDISLAFKPLNELKTKD